MIQVKLAKSKKAAEAAVADTNLDWVAIETEYGEETVGIEVPEIKLALNHHGEHQSNKPPALVYQDLTEPVRHDNFVISHIDLDTLFGILWTSGLLRVTSTTEQLSFLVAEADTKGFHTIPGLFKTGNYSATIRNKYYAIGFLVKSWIIKDDGLDLKDVSKEVHKLLLKIKDIIRNGPNKEMTDNVKEWLRTQEEVAQKSLQTVFNLCDDNRLFIFRAPFSLITAYTVKNLEASIIIQYNEQSKSISLGCRDEKTAIKFFGRTGVIKPLQSFFGPDSGGKLTIGGTPRDVKIQPEMVSAFTEYLQREYFNVPTIINLKG